MNKEKSEHPGVDGKDNTKSTLKKYHGKAWTGFCLAQDGYKWQGVVNNVKFRLPQPAGNIVRS